MSIFALALAIAAPLPTAQAVPAPAATEALDPAKLAAARALIDVVMPPATRDGLIQAMLQPMMANLQQAMLSNPTFKQQIGADPKVRAIVDRFVARRTAATLAKLQTGLPGMFAAMERAYARRFTIAQMADAQAFFSTPSGSAYMREGMTIMSDPDVQTWQRAMMQESMGDMNAELVQLMAELNAAATAK